MADIPSTERVKSDFMVENQVEDTNQSKQSESLQDRIVKLVKGLIGWIPVMILMILPALAGYAVGYGVALGWSVFMQCIEFYKWRTGTTKVWPKILDVGIITLSFILLIVEVTTHPNDEFHQLYSGIVVNGGLAVIVLISIVVDQPFTLQFAKEALPPSKWDNPGVIFSCRVTAWLWFGIFDLMVLVQCIPIMAGDNNPHDTLSLVCGTILPLVILVVGFKASDMLVAFLRKKGLEMAAKQGANAQTE